LGADVEWFSGLIVWWCAQLGISDPMAVSIAQGCVAAIFLFYIVYFILTVVFALVLRGFR
jgi:hypothetical protein